MFFSHIKPAPASSHQSTSGTFLSQQTSTSHCIFSFLFRNHGHRKAFSTPAKRGRCWSGRALAPAGSGRASLSECWSTITTRKGNHARHSDGELPESWLYWEVVAVARISVSVLEWMKYSTIFKFPVQDFRGFINRRWVTWLTWVLIDQLSLVALVSKWCWLINQTCPKRKKNLQEYQINQAGL